MSDVAPRARSGSLPRSGGKSCRPRSTARLVQAAADQAGATDEQDLHVTASYASAGGLSRIASGVPEPRVVCPVAVQARPLPSGATLPTVACQSERTRLRRREMSPDRRPETAGKSVLL